MFNFMGGRNYHTGVKESKLDWETFELNVNPITLRIKQKSVNLRSFLGP